MIVFSLLLILVAVMLLVMGLAGGSSSLLIASIVASLLAAIALVVGARQAAVARRAATIAPDPLAVDLDADPGTAAPVVNRRASRRRRAAGDRVPVGTPAGAGTAAGGAQSGPDHAEAAAFAAGGGDTEEAFGRRDGDEAFGRDAGPYPRSEPTAPDAATSDPRYADAGVEGAPQGDETQVGRRPGGRAGEPDYDRAATFIGGARAQGGDDARGSDPAAAKAEAALAADAGSPAADAGSADARTDVPGGSGFAGGSGLAGGSGFASGSDFVGGSGFADGAGPSDGSGLSEEFGEPDPDDPDDEPLPQAFRPGDAVRVARMDAEVLVVDGRPRYHLADCPHLVGRLTEPLAVSEAVELGFSPCGLCRPIDRLVAAAARH
jgi:hypothetical protein